MCTIAIEALTPLDRISSKSIPRYISTKEHSYFCGGVNLEEEVYAPAEVTMFLSADISRHRLGASLNLVYLVFKNVRKERSIQALLLQAKRSISRSILVHNRPFSYSEKESQSNDTLLHFVKFLNVHNSGRHSNATQSNLVYKNIYKLRSIQAPLLNS